MAEGDSLHGCVRAAHRQECEMFEPAVGYGAAFYDVSPFLAGSAVLV